MTQNAQTIMGNATLGAISNHNNSDNAHSDLRNRISTLEDEIIGIGEDLEDMTEDLLA